MNIDVKVSPTKKVIVYGVDARSPENIAWCAATYGINRLFWVDGYLLCVEVYDKSFAHEIAKKEFPISHVCYASASKYAQVIEVRKGVEMPVVNASDMMIFQNLLKAILKPKRKPRKKQH